MKVLVFLASGAILFFAGYWFGLSGDEQSIVMNDELVSKNSIIDKIASEELNSVQESNAARVEKIEDLQRIIKKLKEELNKAKKNLRKKGLQVENFLNEADRSQVDIKKQSTSEEKHTDKITKAAAELALPKPFSNFFVDATGRRAEEFNRFQNETQDYDWAYLMEIQIKDFMTIHYEAGNIDVQSVKCKTTTCEITGFESEEQKAQIILRDMREQDWWEFRNTSSSSSQSTEFGQYFYVSLSK